MIATQTIQRSAFLADKITAHIGTTPEGYLVCLGVPICRSGWQEYEPSEVGLAGSERIKIWRDPEEVADAAHVASANGKTVTSGHPSRFLDADNTQWASKGHIQHPRVEWLDRGGCVLLADLVITDSVLASQIKTGQLRDVSAGYEYALAQRDDGSHEMGTLRLNHLAIVEKGRANFNADKKFPRIAIGDAAPPMISIAKRFLGRDIMTVAHELEAEREITARATDGAVHIGGEPRSWDELQRDHNPLHEDGGSRDEDELEESEDEEMTSAEKVDALTAAVANLHAMVEKLVRKQAEASDSRRSTVKDAPTKSRRVARLADARDDDDREYGARISRNYLGKHPAAGKASADAEAARARRKTTNDSDEDAGLDPAERLARRFERIIRDRRAELLRNASVKK